VRDWSVEVERSGLASRVALDDPSSFAIRHSSFSFGAPANRNNEEWRMKNEEARKLLLSALVGWPNHDEAAVRTRDRALNEQQPVIPIHLDDA